MNDKTESPQAFPVTWPNASPDLGMSLRDYFAGQALAGLLVNDNSRTHSSSAADAYGYADAMLKVRMTPAPPKETMP